MSQAKTQRKKEAQPAPRSSLEAASAPEQWKLDWVAWPARRQLLAGVGVLMLIAVLSALVRYSLESRLYAGICFVTLIIAVSPFYLPTQYVLGKEGVLVRSVLGNRFKAWGMLRVYFRDGDRGVLLSPVPHYGLLARTRGIYLPFQENQEQVLAFVEKHLPPGARKDKDVAAGE